MREWRRKPRPDDPPGLPGDDFEQLEIRAATARNMTLLAWRQQPDDDRARMLAFDMKERTVEAYSQEWREHYHERNKSGNAGDREFRAMQKENSLRDGHSLREGHLGGTLRDGHRRAK